MNKNQQQIHIIGAGVSGLVAALELERAGFQPIIIEQSNQVGGRVKTDVQKGYLFDHGFQVLLTQYPAAKRYLNFDQLELQYFLPGTVIFKNGNHYKIGDPRRHGSFLWSTLMASVGSIGDKVKILKLSNQLKKQSINSIFQEPETTTLEYLKKFGFSDRIISSFFKPFYSGIFLEPELQTSSRMFCFVYKMFSEGYAAIPKYGIKAISQQLKSKLKGTQFRLNTKVRQVDGNLLTLDDGSTLHSDKTIIATNPKQILPSFNKTQEWHSCINLYFKADESILKQPIIGLIANTDALVNNFHYVTDIQPNNGPAILSVTVVRKQNLPEQELLQKVKRELSDYLGIDSLKLLKSYTIQQALPKLNNLKYAPTISDVQLSERLFLAGDYLSNASLNAAMESGMIAAKALIESFDLNQN